MARGRQELRWLQVYGDPVQHAAIAAAVVAPLAARARRRVVGTAVTAALVIDVDHAVAARSMWPRATTALARRPRTHRRRRTPRTGPAQHSAQLTSGVLAVGVQAPAVRIPRIPLAIASIVASAVLASGCGGEDEPRARAAPVAKAGLDQAMPDAELV